MINKLDLSEIKSELPLDCIKMCSSSEDNWPACKFWVDELKFSYPRMACIELLLDYGFEEDELITTSDDDLNIAVLCLAVWDRK